MPDQVAYWNAQAVSFDDAADHGLRDADVYAAWAALLESLLPPAPARVADIGCGTGTLSCLVARQGLSVSAIDLAPEMITRARQKAAAQRLAVEFVVGDAGDLPWPDQHFDAVLCRHVLWAMDDPAAGLEEWLRVLRPSGRLVLIEGRWSTGAGLAAPEVVGLLSAAGCSAVVNPLRDVRLWGQEISDERYAIVSRPTAGPEAGAS